MTSKKLNLFWAIIYGCFISAIGYSAVFQGLSHFYATAAFHSGSVEDAETAIRLKPADADAHKTLGVVLLRQKKYAEAAAAFQDALERRPEDFLLWLRLGYSRYKAGDLPGADVAYAKAVDIAPHYAQPHYYFGKMLFETGRGEQAFKHLSSAAERDLKYYLEVLHLARTYYADDPAAIEAAVRPGSVEGKRIFAFYFLKHAFVTPGLVSFLTGDELDENQKDAFTRYLLNKNNFSLAREVWSSKFGREASGIEAPLLDGGFETFTGGDESGFGWHVPLKAPGFSMARVSDGAHGGGYAVEINFSGEVPLGEKILSQLVIVEPHRRYRIDFFYRSDEIISIGPPVVAVLEPRSGNPLAQSAPLKASGGKWIASSVDFVAGEDTAVYISLQRTKCDMTPCPIFGSLSLDDFSLTAR